MHRTKWKIFLEKFGSLGKWFYSWLSFECFKISGSSNIIYWVGVCFYNKNIHCFWVLKVKKRPQKFSCNECSGKGAVNEQKGEEKTFLLPLEYRMEGSMEVHWWCMHPKELCKALRAKRQWAGVVPGIGGRWVYRDKAPVWVVRLLRWYPWTNVRRAEDESAWVTSQ